MEWGQGERYGAGARGAGKVAWGGGTGGDIRGHWLRAWVRGTDGNMEWGMGAGAGVVLGA